MSICVNNEKNHIVTSRSMSLADGSSGRSSRRSTVSNGIDRNYMSPDSMHHIERSVDEQPPSNSENESDSETIPSNVQTISRIDYPAMEVYQQEKDQLSWSASFLHLSSTTLSSKSTT